MTKTLLTFIVVLIISFIGFQIYGLEDIAIVLRSLILPLVTVLYCKQVGEKKSYFFYFLLVYSISEFIGVFSSFATTSIFLDNLIFYGGNLLYIIAYALLSIEILRSMNLKSVINRFPIHIIILFVLDIYSVILVTEVAVESDYLSGTLDYTLEIFYNMSIMFLLTVTLINYVSRDSKKAMNLLIGAICIVVSEVIQVAHFYVIETAVLSVVYPVLLIIAFGFFYLQSKMEYVEEKDYETIKKLETESFSDNR